MIVGSVRFKRKKIYLTGRCPSRFVSRGYVSPVLRYITGKKITRQHCAVLFILMSVNAVFSDPVSAYLVALSVSVVVCVVADPDVFFVCAGSRSGAYRCLLWCAVLSCSLVYLYSLGLVRKRNNCR